MSLETLIKNYRQNNKQPIAIHTDGDITYVIYGIVSIGQNKGYSVLKITDSDNTTAIEKGLLLESTRISGSNGSTNNVNLKTDYTNTLLLLTDDKLNYN